MQQMSSTWSSIRDLRPGMKGVNVQFIVLEKGHVTTTKDNNTLKQYLIADMTGAIYLSIWDDTGAPLIPSDIVELRGGFCALFKNALVLYMGRFGSLKKIGSFQMLFSEMPNMSKVDWVPDPANTDQLVPAFMARSSHRQYHHKQGLSHYNTSRK
mmetsp:Transcript_2298/g.2576  ORF Transcript_2298/g.2576 Transcript_2298/m.2576 type:complete len:155 (+) Transcript_2298:58-522(+)